MGVPIYALPYRQFFLHKDSSEGFRFVDLTDSYGRADVKTQLPGSYSGRRVPTRFESIAPKVKKRLPPNAPQL